MIWAERVKSMGRGRVEYRGFVEIWGKRPLGRRSRRWDVNIEIDFRELGCGRVEWIDLAQDEDGWRTVLNAVMTFGVP